MAGVFGTILLGCGAVIAVIITGVFVVAAGKGIYDICKKK